MQRRPATRVGGQREPVLSREVKALIVSGLVIASFNPNLNRVVVLLPQQGDDV